MVQWLKCLFGKHEDPSSVPRAHGKNSGKVACVCHPCTEEIETGQPTQVLLELGEF